MTVPAASRAVEDSGVTEVSGRTGSKGWLSRAVHRLTASEHELDAEDLQEDVDRSGCAAVSRCRRGEQVQIVGRLKSVVYTPRETLPTLEAELWDGSGTVLLVWLGRRRINGIEPGRCLIARGRLANREGVTVIYNPWYELQAPPR